jgi:acetyl esterase/lipase
MRGYRTVASALALQIAILPLSAVAAPGAGPEVVHIWPGAAPGTQDWTGPETDKPIPGMSSLHLISNVTTPTLTVVRPAPGTATGNAMIVIPGGGFQYLAITHEGEMVARWLADRGITAFILKYRVRESADFRLPSDARHHPEQFDAMAKKFEGGRQLAIADALQAMRYLRANASRFAIRPDHLGMMGFSAGALTTTGVILNGQPADQPNIAAPIYGAMEDKAPPTSAPPLFIAATQDDNAVPVSKSIEIFSRWTAANLPAELHIYERGGHGFGMMQHHLPVDDWTTAFAAWLKMHGWLNQAKAP